MKANASSVTSKLGGGLHGHHGLAISSSEYNDITSTEDQKPVHAGHLKIVPGTPIHDAI